MAISVQTLLIPCGGTALVILIYIWLAWYVLHVAPDVPADDNNTNNESSNSRHGLSKEDIQKLPTFICNCHHHYTNKEEEQKEEDTIQMEKVNEELCISDDLECCVCLEEFKDGERCLLMPTCKHCFHVDCADAWLSKSPICPLCRGAAFPKGEEHEKQGATSTDHIADSIVIDIPS